MILKKHTHSYLRMNTPIMPVSCFALSTLILFLLILFKKSVLYIKPQITVALLLIIHFLLMFHPKWTVSLSKANISALIAQISIMNSTYWPCLFVYVAVHVFI